jgi:hypothetical protein
MDNPHQHAAILSCLYWQSRLAGGGAPVPSLGARGFTEGSRLSPGNPTSFPDPSPIWRILGLTWAFFCLLGCHLPIRHRSRSLVRSGAFLGFLGHSRLSSGNPASLPDPSPVGRILGLPWTFFGVLGCFLLSFPVPGPLLPMEQAVCRLSASDGQTGGHLAE